MPSDNVLEGAAGADVLDGGDGLDTASYAASNAAVTVDLLAGTAIGGHATGDTFAGIENLSGSRYNDTLTGDTKANRLDGGSGHDRLMGGAGADVLVGGPGNDAAYYASSAAAVTVNLGTSTATGGDAEGDTLDSIENLSGSAFEDSLTGNARNNVLSGRAGADLLDGGAGTDTVSYSGSRSGVTVNLLTGAGERGDAEGDMLSNIENLIGSRYNDDLTGDTGPNLLRGRGWRRYPCRWSGRRSFLRRARTGSGFLHWFTRRRHRAPAQPGRQGWRCSGRYLREPGGRRLYRCERCSADRLSAGRGAPHRLRTQRYPGRRPPRQCH